MELFLVARRTWEAAPPYTRPFGSGIQPSLAGAAVEGQGRSGLHELRFPEWRQGIGAVSTVYVCHADGNDVGGSGRPARQQLERGHSQRPEPPGNLDRGHGPQECRRGLSEHWRPPHGRAIRRKGGADRPEISGRSFCSKRSAGRNRNSVPRIRRAKPHLRLGSRKPATRYGNNSERTWPPQEPCLCMEPFPVIGRRIQRDSLCRSLLRG
jgi:hypothetical protein